MLYAGHWNNISTDKRLPMLTKSANTIFLVSNITTFLSLAAVVTTQWMYAGSTVSLSNSTLAKIAFGVIFVLASIAVVAQFVLWIGMISFTIQDKDQSVMAKVFGLFLQLVFVSVGSAIVYFTVYRRRYKLIEN
jgi:hypothetical protein